MAKKKSKEATRPKNPRSLKQGTRTVSETLQIEERDMDLLKEYGFKSRSIRSASMNMKKIDKMNMRQLDRVKMMLLRNSALCKGYPGAIQRGINHNDTAAFSKALALLGNFVFSE